MYALLLPQFLAEFSETEMRNQFLLRKEENAIFLFVDPYRNICLFNGIGNQEHCSQVPQFAEFIEANLSFRRTPLIEKNLLIESFHKQMGVLGYLFRTRLPQMWDEI